MNNQGWGLRIMLFFCIILISFIFVAAFIVNKNFESIAPKNEYEEKYNYFDLEVKMVNATKKYMNDNYTNIVSDIEIPVKLKTLISKNYLAPIKDYYTKKECNGYVIFIRKNNNIEYDPYLKCDGYKTNGYDSIYD